jgi:hypothetical protein
MITQIGGDVNKKPVARSRFLAWNAFASELAMLHLVPVGGTALLSGVDGAILLAVPGLTGWVIGLNQEG